MRLIDADALKEKLIKERDAIPETLTERYGFGVEFPNYFGDARRGGIKTALRCMEQTPTVDVVPVPCKIGDEVYAIRYYKGCPNVTKGIVSEMFFDNDMELLIVVKHISRGHWLETVFPTFETAALEVRKRKKIKAGTCHKEET